MFTCQGTHSYHTVVKGYKVLFRLWKDKNVCFCSEQITLQVCLLCAHKLFLWFWPSVTLDNCIPSILHNPLYSYEIMLTWSVVVVAHCYRVQLGVCIHARWKESQHIVSYLVCHSVWIKEFASYLDREVWRGFLVRAANTLFQSSSLHPMKHSAKPTLLFPKQPLIVCFTQ